MVDINDYAKLTSTGLELMAGRILISVPFFVDSFFNRSVVLLTDFEDVDVAGLIINFKSENNINSVAKDIKLYNNIYIGGPVNLKFPLCLHNYSGAKKSYKILPNVYAGYDETLLSMMEHNALDKLKYKFFTGYSCWTREQLIDEVQNGMWIVANVSSDLIFDTPSEDIWSKAVTLLGCKYRHWLNLPHNITDN